MKQQIIEFLSKLDQALFPEDRAEIVVVRSKRPKHERSLLPIAYANSTAEAKEDYSVLLQGRNIPEGKALYLLFEKEIVQYIIKIQFQNPTLDLELVTWGVCISVVWERVQKMQLKLIVERGKAGMPTPNVFALLLVPKEVEGLLAPYCQMSAEDIEYDLQTRYQEVRAQPNVIHPFGSTPDEQEMSVVVQGYQSAQRDALSGLCPFCKTEENAIEFLKKCKEALFAKV